MLARIYTATILNWKPLLSDNLYKDIIISSLQFLVSNQRIELNAFVMLTHFSGNDLMLPVGQETRRGLKAVACATHQGGERTPTAGESTANLFSFIKGSVHGFDHAGS